MPRNRKRRRMGRLPDVKGMYPSGNRHAGREPVLLNLEEYETLRLTDYLNLTHQEGSAEMNVSRATYTRIYENARAQVAKAIVEARPLIIEGGSVELQHTSFKCLSCGNIFSEKQASPSMPTSCPDCGSSDIRDMSDCYFKGCGHCQGACDERDL